MLMILIAAGCYTICSLADKYAVTEAKLNGKEISFIMALATAFFMTLLMPFIDHNITFTWQSVVFIGLVAIDKFLEFKMSAIILEKMSAFELKAWLGLTLFASYFTDIAMKATNFSIIGTAFIAVTAVGLFLLASTSRKEVDYKKIAIPLVIYLAVKFGYGFIMKQGAVFMPSTLILYFALILLTLVLLPQVKLKKLIQQQPKKNLVVALTKLPNALGLIAENIVIATSLTGFSLIQPIILTSLFFIGIFRNEQATKLSIIGGIIIIFGIIGFKISNNM